MIKKKIIQDVIGKGFADKLDEPLFELSKDFTYSRRQMVEELGCANFIAAIRLVKVLKRLNITSATQLRKMDPQSLARARGIGEAALFVAMSILDSHGFSVTDWWGWNDNVVKFSTFKAHAIRRARKHKQAS